MGLLAAFGGYAVAHDAALRSVRGGHPEAGGPFPQAPR